MKIIFNPFLRTAGWPALIYGLAGLIITAWLSAIYDVHLDNILSMHINGEVSLSTAFMESFTNWLTLILVFGLAAWILNRMGFRLLDLLGIMALVRMPFLVLPPVNGLFQIGEIDQKLKAGIVEGSNEIMLTAGETVRFAGYIITVLLFIILSATWMYHGFRLLSNTRGLRANITFIIALVAATAISEITVTIIQ